MQVHGGVAHFTAQQEGLMQTTSIDGVTPARAPSSTDQQRPGTVNRAMFSVSELTGVCDKYERHKINKN